MIATAAVAPSILLVGELCSAADEVTMRILGVIYVSQKSLCLVSGSLVKRNRRNSSKRALN